MPLPNETTISHYRIINKLGAGGMGEVYLAADTRLDRKVALKILPEQFTKDESRLRHFVQEAKATSALNHPNIITIHDIGEAPGESGGTHFIASEFIDGHTLRGVMTSGQLQLGDALDIASQVASALAAAHDAGIVHRGLETLVADRSERRSVAIRKPMKTTTNSVLHRTRLRRAGEVHVRRTCGTLGSSP